MKRFIALTALFVACLGGMYAQHDTKSKDMLDQLSKKTQAYKTVEVIFSFNITNKDQNIDETQSGTLKMKGDKYYLKMDSKEIYCDAKKIYTYDRDTKECQVISVDEVEEGAITPKSIFTIYEQGFKSKVKEEKKDGKGRNIMIIDLFPLQPKEKDYTMVRLEVDKDKVQVIQATILGKNGSTYYYNITSLTPDKNMDDSIFDFDKSKYPGVKMIE